MKKRVRLIHIVFVSSTFLHRTEPVYVHKPHHNLVWVLVSVAILLVQMAFFAISMIFSPVGLGDLSWWIYVLGLLGGPLLILPIQELVKLHDKQEWLRFQKRSKLEFNTKLGMHSPV